MTLLPLLIPPGELAVEMFPSLGTPSFAPPWKNEWVEPEERLYCSCFSGSMERSVADISGAGYEGGGGKGEVGEEAVGGRTNTSELTGVSSYGNEKSHDVSGKGLKF